MTETASGARKLRSAIVIDTSSDEDMQAETTTFSRRGGARGEKQQISAPAQQASSNMTNESSSSRRMTRNTNINQSKNVDEDSNLLCSENLDGEEFPSPTSDFLEEEPAPKKPRIDLSLAKILRPARNVVSSKKSSKNKNGSGRATEEKSPKAAAAKPPAPQPSRASARPSRREQKTAVPDSTVTQGSLVSPTEKASGEVVTRYITLPSLAARCPPLPKLDSTQVKNLEEALQLDSSDPDGGWREDWMGNLGFLHKDVPNPTLSKPKRKSGAATLPFWEWGLGSTTGAACKVLVHHLLIYVYHLKNTPQMAKSILAHSVSNEADIVSTVNAVARISYDPVVLQQDGWTTQKESEYQGASGGAYHIGSHVIWQKYEAVVVAYVHDHDMGDLWKAMWLEEHDTFDMEAEELQSALKKYERKKNIRSNSDATLPSTQNSTSSRFASAKNYVVDDIENGIVLAGTYHPQARHGVLWPARVMHVSENTSIQPQSKRGSAKNRISVVFLAPYWNRPITGGGRRVVEPYGENLSQAKSMFDSGPLFEMDTIEVSSEMLQKYPYNGRELKIDQLRDAFRFSGLPKAAFPRFLDSHRLAMALKTYSSAELKAPATTLGDSRAISTLSDTHVMAIQTAMFPLSILHLPFDYILSELPPPTTEHSATLDQGEETVEPVLDLRAMLNAMTPPHCWGMSQSIGGNNQMVSPAKTTSNLNPMYTHDVASPLPIKSNGESRVDDLEWNLNQFCSEYLLETLSKGETTHLSRLIDDLSVLISQLRDVSLKWEKLDSASQATKSHSLLNRCMLCKSHGEESIHCGLQGEVASQKLVVEWRKSCERIFKRATIKFSSTEAGNGVTMILTDHRCNEHLTASGCVERVVRLPAAIKASKMAGAGKSRDIQLIFPVEDRFINMAEKTVLPKAHKASYLKRMKAKCAAIEPGRKGAMLTDDSDGNGGEDTMGSRGSYTAAVAGVAAALQAVDRIASGQCVNAFCATRPPGHHAGRDLHSMKAVSNGFCVLNPAACAALYATTPQSEGGPGFRRVCVIDFDVHHGNGTQDILCNTYDPRFLYVSIHAGGAHINGYDTDDDDSGQNNSQRPGGSSQNAGIYPGRCGDTCPHEGVLNLPLGAKVTAQHVGQVLASKVSPAVDAFAPDLIVLSAGFDAHKNDPLGMGGLSAEDFGSITTVACSMAFRSCSGRVISILEGGYGVPCCRPQMDDLFLPKSSTMEGESPYTTSKQTQNIQTSVGDSNPSPKDKLMTNLLEQQEGSTQKQEKGAQIKLLDLGEDLPDNMEDEVPRGLRGKVDRCHTEGFIDCVREHVSSLAKSNTRK